MLGSVIRMYTDQGMAAKIYLFYIKLIYVYVCIYEGF